MADERWKETGGVPPWFLPGGFGYYPYREFGGAWAGYPYKGGATATEETAWESLLSKYPNISDGQLIPVSEYPDESMLPKPAPWWGWRLVTEDPDRPGIPLSEPGWAYTSLGETPTYVESGGTTLAQLDEDYMRAQIEQMRKQTSTIGQMSPLDEANYDLAVRRLAHEMGMDNATLELERQRWLAGLRANESDWIESWFAERMPRGGRGQYPMNYEPGGEFPPIGYLGEGYQPPGQQYDPWLAPYAESPTQTWEEGGYPTAAYPRGEGGTRSWGRTRAGAEVISSRHPSTYPAHEWGNEGWRGPSPEPTYSGWEVGY